MKIKFSQKTLIAIISGILLVSVRVSDAADQQAQAPASAGGSPPRTGQEVREQIRTLWADIGRIVAPNGIDEKRNVKLGWAEQWIMLRGQDKTAPVLLFLHGGPGSPISPSVYTYQRPWEDFFLVVHWDQRGFGRSRGKNLKDDAALAGTLNRKQLISDTIELIEKLRAEFDQDKIVLVGQSWGTVLALEVAHSRPDLLYAVVTQGLAANWMASPQLLYEYLLQEAASNGDEVELNRLRELGPVPPPEPPDAMFAWARKLGVGFPDANTWHNILGPNDSWARRMDAIEYVSPDFSAEEYAARKAYQEKDPAAVYKRYQEAMATVLPWDAEHDVGTNLKVPFIVMQGSHDWQTSRDLAKDYFDKVCAPYKKWIEFPHAAHALNIEQPGLSIMSLVNDVLPAVRGDIPTGAITCQLPD